MLYITNMDAPDIIFFVAIFVVVALVLLMYFLMPVIKRKQYEEQRANLSKREATFRANLKQLQEENVTIEEKE